MFKFIKRILTRKSKKKSCLTRDEQRNLLGAQSDFFYKEAMAAYQRAVNAHEMGDEEGFKVARKQFFIAERRHKMTSLEICNFINNE